MCNPIAIAAGSLVTGLWGQQQEGRAQAAMYEAQAQAADANKRISDRKQEQIADQQLQERNKMDARMRLVAGQNAAETGASGLMMSGTPLDLMASSYDEYNNDIQNWETNKNNAIYNEYLNGVNYQNQANAARASAANAKSQARINMFSTILSGASTMYGLKQQYGGGKYKTTYGGDLQGVTDRPVKTVKRNKYGW